MCNAMKQENRTREMNDEEFILTNLNYTYKVLSCILRMGMNRLTTVLKLQAIQHNYDQARQRLIEEKIQQLMSEAKHHQELSVSVAKRVDRIKNLIEKIEKSNNCVLRKSNRHISKSK